MPIRILICCLLVVALVTTMHSVAMAQPGPAPTITTWNLGGGSGTGNWNVAANWDPAGVPNVTEEDAAIINGGGTAQINSAIATPIGSVVLGQGAVAGQSGTLEIQSGGTLNVIDDPAFPADGSVRVGQNVGQGLNANLDAANTAAGTGTLRVLPGGTLNSVSLSLGGTPNSSITLGGTAAGTATVNTAVATLGRTTRVIGPNVNFTSSGMNAGINFQNMSVFIPEITGSNHSALKTTGNAALGGTLQVDFNGVTPTVGQSWNILDAASVTGAFASILPDPGLPLGAGQIVTTRTVSGGANGRLVQLLVQQLPIVTVNRGTGAVAITNPGTAGVPLDGYTIESPSGSLSLANWQSLEDTDVAGPDWVEANPSANRLSELKPVSTGTLVGGGSWGLGNVFQPAPPTQFGVSREDLVVQFNDPITQSTVNGIVQYVGTENINNLVLFVDPATGNVKIRNSSPFTVAIDGYTIVSNSGSLNSNDAQWTSLSEQPGVAGPTWFESTLTDNRVSELRSSGSTSMPGNGATTFDLGGLFKTAGSQDLVFQFLLAGNSQPNTGLVLYQAAPPGEGVRGDYNNNGTVDAADYVLWRNGGPLQNDSTPGVGADDYAVWRANFGRTAAAGSGALASAAVPEPATILLLAATVLVLAAARQRPRFL
jgi:hypothetical protein